MPTVKGRLVAASPGSGKSDQNLLVAEERPADHVVGDRISIAEE
jgi:hypothetical protein